MVPVLTQTPPTIPLVSTMHTLWPSLAAMIAAFWPPGPEPMTARSKAYVCSIAQACQTIDTFASYGFGGLLAWKVQTIKTGPKAGAGLAVPPADQWSATYPAWT